MSTSKTRANRRRLANKLRMLQGKFEQTIVNQSNDYTVANLSMPKQPKENVFKIMQGKRLRRKLGYKLSNVFKDFYEARRAHNKELGYTATGKPLKVKTSKVIYKKVDSQKIATEKTMLHTKGTHEQIAMYYYRKMYS